MHWLRVVLYWQDVAPAVDSRSVPAFDETDPAAYDWAIYDRLFADAQARGLRLLVTVSGPGPRWATRSREDRVTRPSSTRFRRFVTAVGRRYGDQVDYWSVWNEPNHPGFLGPQYVHGRAYSPRLYRQLYRAALDGLERSGNGRDRVLMGETAPRGNSHVVPPLEFVRGSLCLTSSYQRRKGCGSLDVDGWAHHPYTTSKGPWFVSLRPDDVTIGSLSRLTRALDRARRAHAVRKRVDLYLTEFGVQSEPDQISGVSEMRQAEYRSISELIAYRNPRVRAFSQYLMRDDFPRAGSAAAALRRLRVRPAALRRRGEAGLRRLPAAARGRARALDAALGARAARRGPDHGADRVPQPRLVEVADAQARPHGFPRLLGDHDVVSIRAQLPRALGSIRRFADARLPSLVPQLPAGVGVRTGTAEPPGPRSGRPGEPGQFGANRRPCRA